MQSLRPGPSPNVPARQLVHVSLLLAPVSGLKVPRGHCWQSADELLPACSLFHRDKDVWYHPNGHGNALLQVGGGASGTIIIRDPPGKLPEYVDEAPELLLHVNHLPIAQILGYGAQSCVSRCG